MKRYLAIEKEGFDKLFKKLNECRGDGKITLDLSIEEVEALEFSMINTKNAQAELEDIEKDPQFYKVKL